jgi:hypothetical protein
MIAHPHRLPHVVWQNQRLVPLSERWLTESIEHAARRAGYSTWELAPHLARAVAIYLEEQCGAGTVSVERLQKLVQASLEGVGYREVAEVSVILPPRISIYLPELAARAPYELMFFPALGERLREALAFQIRGVNLEGLRDCSKILAAAQKWRQACHRLSEQIIFYSHACLEKANALSVELQIC